MSNLFHDPRFWLAISFVIFLGLMLKYALPPILRMLDGKVKKILDEVLKASEAKDQAKKLLADAEKYYQDSVHLAQKLLSEAEIEAANLIAHSQKIVEEEVQRKLDLINKRIQQEEDRAIREIKNWLITSAINAMRETISKSGDKKNSSQIINRSIIDVSKLIN